MVFMLALRYRLSTGASIANAGDQPVTEAVSGAFQERHKRVYNYGNRGGYMAELALFVFGPPRLERDRSPVIVPRRKALALLVYLAITHRPQAREALIALLWPESDAASAHAAMRQAVLALNQSLGRGYLESAAGRVGLAADAPLSVDANTFASLLERVAGHHHAANGLCDDCLEALVAAARMYSGDFLAGFTLVDSPSFDEWQLLQTESLRRDLAGVLEKLARTLSARGQHEPALAHARRWLALDPLCEPAERTLMQLYAACGERSAAVRLYDECTRRLRTELGAAPEAETTRLRDQILDGAGKGKLGGQLKDEQAEQAQTTSRPDSRPIAEAGLLGEAEAGPFGAPAPHNLPAPLTPLVGRGAELATLAGRLADPACRLVTLTGPGGSGKSRLALEAGLRQRAHFADGVFLVSLSPSRRTGAGNEALCAAIAQSAELPTAGPRTGDVQRRLLDHLRRKSMLLILDNLEQVLEVASGDKGGPGGAGTVEEGSDARYVLAGILAGAPGVKILATSRVALDLSSEQLLPVEGLEVPPESRAASDLQTMGAFSDGSLRAAPGNPLDYSAVQLFVQSARRLKPDFVPTPADLEQIGHLCRLVGGLPLAILLAASWVTLLSPAEIVARVATAELDFLEAGWQDLPERQRSLRRVFDGSWNLLSAHQRGVLATLCIFRGGFDHQAAEQVAGASLQDLRELLVRSLIEHIPGKRYDLHPLLRQYAREKLAAMPGGDGPGRRSHCAHYAQCAHNWTALAGHARAAPLEEIAAEVDNLRAALAWAVGQRDAHNLPPLCDALFSYLRAHELVREIESTSAQAAQALEKEAAATNQEALVALTRVRGLQMIAASLQGRDEEAKRLEAQAWALLEHPRLTGRDLRAERARLLYTAGWIHCDGGKRAVAGRMWREALGLYRELGDEPGALNVLEALAFLATSTGEYGQCRLLSEECILGHQRLGQTRGMIFPLIWLAWACGMQGSFAEGQRHAREAMELARPIDDDKGLAEGLMALGGCLAMEGRFAEAQGVLQQIAGISEEFATPVSEEFSEWLSWSEVHLGQYERVREREQVELARHRRNGRAFDAGRSLRSLGYIALAEGDLTTAEQRLQEAVELLRPISQPEDLAEVVGVTGFVLAQLGKRDEGEALVREALRTAGAIGNLHCAAIAVAALAGLCSLTEQSEVALEWHALASRYGCIGNSRFWEDVVGRRIAEEAAALPGGVAAAAQARGEQRDLYAAIAEVLQLGE
jgi:DNA-binding SARP family transcriptional activator/predicted ATPase